jgi:N-acetylmuramoyl-L-alanine amidase
MKCVMGCVTALTAVVTAAMGSFAIAAASSAVELQQQVKPDQSVAVAVASSSPLSSQLNQLSSDSRPSLLASAPLRPSSASPGAEDLPEPDRSEPPAPGERSSPPEQRSLPQRRPSSSSSPGASLGFNYRVIVPGSSDALLRQVRRIAPDAFRTTIDRRGVIQAGLYVAREDAEDLERRLNQQNLEARVLDIDQGVSSQLGQVPQMPQSSQSPPFSGSPAADLPRISNGRPVVVLDPGHGGGDPGAVGIGGLHEADVVLPIAQRVATLLEQQGIQAVLTREDDREIDLEPRVNLAQRLNADLFVSIHANSINLSRPDINGIETYYYSSTAAQQLAQTLRSSILQQTGMIDRGIHQARFYVLTHTSMPASLVEIGFVTGQEDAAKLSNPAFRNRIAEGIAQGILQYIQQGR